MSLNNLMSNIKSFLEDLNDNATPTPNNYLDHVWIGKPNKLPMGARAVSFIEIANEPNFYYTTCDTILQGDTDVMITIMSKGKVTEAHTHLYEIIDAFKATWKSNRKFGNSCISSTIEEIEYGDVAESSVEPKILATAARIKIRCRMD